ncbi:aldose epimerase family protein [Bariatricus sp. SGI.154]|uniref:aldose epimerase family protein n=1 Tax=Bariatricus sp. SGI.154 TaxID=3420549 RepID=UPI003D0953D0
MVSSFGVTSKGVETSLYTLKNQNGMVAAVSDFGATLVQIQVPDKDGKVQDVVLGYDDVKGYEAGTLYFGATVGRVANRIGKASFELNGKTYQLTQNDNQNSLHGGRDYYNYRMWETEEVDDNHVTFLLHSEDGDQGYPGNVDIRVTYTLTEENEVKIHYVAVPEEDTLLNLTNHSYFNLSGNGSGTVLDQEVMICADAYTRADAESIPTGEIVPVEGTPMDFRQMKPIGKEIEADYEALHLGGGYDHNWVLNGIGTRKVAAMHSEATGITMEVYTDLPGMQLYTGNFIVRETGKNGAIYEKRHAACFETQYFPDAVHKDHFQGPVVRAGETYDTTTTYKFFV